YRRSRDEMPAHHWEIEASEKEGIEFQYLALPRRFTGREGRLVQVESVRMRLVPDPEGGRPRPEPLPGSEEVDRLVPGQAVTVLLPRPVVDAATGELALFDYSALTPVTLEVVGLYSFPTHVISMAGRGEKSQPVVEQLLWASSDILVPEETLLTLFALVGGGASLAPVEVTLSVPDFGRVEAYSDALGELLPDYEVMSVPSLVNLGRQRGLPEPVLRLSSYGDAWRRSQPARAVDAGAALVFLLYLIAALLLATNMTVILTSRRKELGVLRAVGARSGEVLVTLLTEAVIVSLLGGLAGFTVTRLASTHVLVSNDRPLAEILALTAADLVVVVTVTVGFALVFGLLAARSASRLSPMEVLRQE
ncbi:MAG: FtsX-like permease family protein, partial [Firmicutes bacterium]|nr:FtsX-like permease family protein [Bacillota bacterium]